MKIYIKPKIRVNNFTNKVEEIIKMWSTIPENGVKYALYFNYESNYKGDYDFSIGMEKGKGEQLEIPEGKYDVFYCKKENLVETWREIWNKEEKNEIVRSYILDYEKHYENGDVEIYVGVK